MEVVRVEVEVVMMVVEFELVRFLSYFFDHLDIRSDLLVVVEDDVVLVGCNMIENLDGRWKFHLVEYVEDCCNYICLMM